MKTVGSMFSGIGGFDIGFERAGFRIAWCIEFDKAAQAVLRKRFPHAKIYGDIREVDALELERVDVICGGFPCQDLSVAGKRAGLAGSRSGLFHDAIRIVRAIKPAIIVLENVPGLLSSNQGHDFATVIRELGEGGDCAEVAWRVLDSQYFGVAQRRRRVFIVASAAIGHAEQVLALAESVCGNPPTRQPKRQDFAASSQGSVANGCQWWDGRDQAASLKTWCHDQIMPDKGNFSAVLVPFTSSSFGAYIEGVGTIRANGGDIGGGSETIVYRKSRRAQSSTDFETWVEDGLSNTLNSFDTGDIRTTHAVFAIPIDLRNATRNAEKLDAQNRQGCGIGNDGDPSPTLLRHHTPGVAFTDAGQGQRVRPVDDVSETLRATKRGPYSDYYFTNKMVVRRLTPVECERLQGFPDGWTDIGTLEKPTADSHRYKQLGNAVTVNVAQWIAQKIEETI